MFARPPVALIWQLAAGDDGGPAGDLPVALPEPAVVDEDARARFVAAYERHYGAIVEFLGRRTRNLSDAEDLAIATFVVAWRRVELLPDEPETRGWLYRLARRELSNSWRAKRRFANLVGRVGFAGEDPVRDPADLTVEQAMIRRAFERLRPRDQEVLVLIYWDGATHEEAARVLGCNANALGVRLHRARNALADAVAALEAAEPARG